MQVKSIKKLTIVSKAVDNLNPFYQPDCNNGAFFQPQITLHLNNGCAVIVYDYDCGSCGDSYYVDYVSRSGKPLLSYQYDGTRSDGQIVAYGNFGTFPALAGWIAQHTGYDVLWQSDDD